PGAPARTVGEIALAPQLNVVLAPFGADAGVLPLVPTQSTFSLSAVANVDAATGTPLSAVPAQSMFALSALAKVDALSAPALPSVPTQSTFALSPIDSVDVVGTPTLTSAPAQSTVTLSAVGSVDNVVPSPRFDAAALGRAPAPDALAFAQPAAGSHSASIAS